MDRLLAGLEAYEQLVESEDFQEDYRDGIIEAEDFDKAKAVVEPTRDVIPLFTLVKELLQKFSDQQDKMIDVQQLAQDEGRIKEFIDETSEWQKQRFDRTIEAFEEYIDRRDEKLEDRDKRLEELMEEMNSIKKTNAKYHDQLSDAINNLASAIDGNSPQFQGSGQRQPPRSGQGSGTGQMQASRRQVDTSANNGGFEDAGNKSTEDRGRGGRPDLEQYDLEDEEKKLIRKFWQHRDDQDFRQGDLAEMTDFSEPRISEKLQEFEDRGIIVR